MTVKCPKCHSENPDTLKFCGECGTQLSSLKDFHPEVTETLQTPIRELTTGSTFAGRYQVIEELGHGGMGRVYKVQDTDIKEKVALKLLRPEITLDKEAVERFSNELKLARKISHRNVCRMFDLGRAEGTTFITMEFVPGEDLKSFIHRSKQLSTGTALSIAQQVCEGLEEAHRLGVIHRDLKPGNIMIDKDGDAKIMDFGIARSLAGKGITGAGVMIGTPEYMSPEQVEGKDIDQRTDIYSLGVILYEMVAGRVPFEGDTPFTVGVKHKSEMAKNPREINPQIPEGLSGIILRCLEKDREKRYQNAADVRSELAKIERNLPTTDRIVPMKKGLTSKETTVKFNIKKILVPTSIVLFLAVAAFLIWHFVPKKESVPATTAKKSIAVLPFEDLSPNRDQAYLCDGITDELINRLINIESLSVPARTSVFSLRGKGLSIQEIGKRLNVDMVLEGSIRKAGNRLRITVQMAAVADGFPVWSEKYERNEEDIFNLQDEISLEVVDKLKIKLLGKEREALVKRHSNNLEAYNLYLQGLYFYGKRTEEDIKKAIEYFEKAIEIEQDFALAYAGIAECYSTLPYYSTFPSSVALQKAKEVSIKALEIDDSLAEPHLALANANMALNLDWTAAETEFRKVINANPNYMKAHYLYALLLMYSARNEEAIREMKKALELDPISLIINRNLGELFYYARQYDEAIDALQKTIEMNPNFSEAHAYTGLIYMQKSMYEEALKELRKEIEIAKGRHPIVESWLGILLARTGKIEQAKKIANDLSARSSREYIPPSWGMLYFALGENEKGFELMEKAFQERDVWLFWIIRDPLCDGVRSHARFKALLSKMNFLR